ncbi:MAG: type 2 isopentenyl-diphosphate Delta-isomerase [Ignavibacteriae bacterium]|nr:MAG: type 2 isopentenyl-diphosphate Delta-isomerase [Ignavibacteriota bacterium]
MKMTRTSSRKQQHVNISLTKDVAFRAKSSGFDRWDFLHNALPEINLSDIDSSAVFLGKKVSLPFIISSMTGGYAKAEQINRQLAEVCAQKKIAMGVGSQRQASENTRYHRSFSVVREAAPDIPVFGNMGAAEVSRLRDASSILRLIDLIQADGFAVHLNPLQEFLQPEGETNFSGVLDGIELLAKALPVPVIVKEIGAGISAEVARRLINVGVSIIDVAGAGGTSWAGVEIVRRRMEPEMKPRRNGAPHKKLKHSNAELFWDWGIPTVDALKSVSLLKNDSPSLKIIASGGISNGIHCAKSIALGADFTASAMSVLQALAHGGTASAIALLDQWEWELKGAMFLTGSCSIAELQKQRLFLRT